MCWKTIMTAYECVVVIEVALLFCRLMNPRCMSLSYQRTLMASPLKAVLGFVSG